MSEGRNPLNGYVDGVTVVRRALALAILVGGLSGCGPVLYTADVIEAEAQMEQAWAENAKWHAPFEYYSAAVYLEKARELAVEGRYEDAIRFARISTVYARRAIRLSNGDRERDAQ